MHLANPQGNWDRPGEGNLGVAPTVSMTAQKVNHIVACGAGREQRSGQFASDLTWQIKWHIQDHNFGSKLRGHV